MLDAKCQMQRLEICRQSLEDAFLSIPSFKALLPDLGVASSAVYAGGHYWYNNTHGMSCHTLLLIV